MINIRKALPSDELFIISTRLDSFIGNKDFYDIPNYELERERDSIKESLKDKLDYCKIVINDGNIIGSFAVYEYEDGTMVDSISLISESATDQIKEFIIKYVISTNYGYIYTFVYDNELALYEKIGFKQLSHENGKYKLVYNNL